MSLLDVQNLRVSFDDAVVVNDVNFSIMPGEKFALVGESGSGKTVTSLSILRLNQDARYEGKILFEGRDILSRPEPAMRALRGKDVAMIFQEPMTALNPLFTVGNQIAEVLMLHEGLSAKAAARRTVELLDKTGIPEPARRALAFPHQLSGGQRQRAMIAMALACRPKLLIADEPTTALDVTIQLQYLKLLKRLQAETGMAILFITHDFGVVGRMCDRVAVMYAGRIVECGPVRQIFEAPAHPYTRALIASVPKMTGPIGRLTTIEGQPPSLMDLPVGCRFASRCPQVEQRCLDAYPGSVQVGDEHTADCWKVTPA